VEFDPAGRASRAVVYDFKTDRGAGSDLARAGARHKAQLMLYRRVVAVLTGLPIASVGAELVFTETAGKVAVVAGA